MYDIKRHMHLNKSKEFPIFFKHNSSLLVFFVNISLLIIFGILFFSTIDIVLINQFYFTEYVYPFISLDSLYYFFSYIIFLSSFLSFLFISLICFIFSFVNVYFLICFILNKLNCSKINEYKKELKEIEDNLTLQKYDKIASSSTVTSKELFFIKRKINALKKDVSFINSFKQKINAIKTFHPELFESRYDYDINKHKELFDKKRDLFNYFEFFLSLILFNNLIILFISNKNFFENNSNFDSFFLSLMFFSLFLFVVSCSYIFSNLRRFFSKSKIEKEMIKKQFNNINKNITISNIEDVINSNDIEDIKFIAPFFKHYEDKLNNEQQLLKLKSSIKEDINKLNYDEHNKKQELKEQKIINKKEINII